MLRVCQDDHTTLTISVTCQSRLAWHYVKYAPDNTALREAEQQTREMNSSHGAGSHGAIAPWDWRKMSKEQRDEYR